ncbi:hypothetical protein JNUCC1_01787 [Lentibacillus sp. JNUCC-1]|uniref:hypothetical protein n=1 Tax=Lentibacillus sp. JNUCC-1 TaxID=2654513 RepID=UPI0012E75318|nr:hypothetical protein [Lentibacillus sp. JNUCC-1]MUV37979.1 hypothetical protein [Lentibacillus sp. JNUCC-1]
MKKILLFIIFLWVIAFLTGCGENGNHTLDPSEGKINGQIKTNLSGHQTIELIAREKTLPSNFDEMAYQRSEVPYFQYLVRKAEDQSEFEDTWNLYEFEAQMPSVNFDKKDIIFIGEHESGSCPAEIDHIKLKSENESMTIYTKVVGGADACTDDATPITFVIQMSKEVSNDLKDIIVAESKVETSVPFEN